MGRENCSVDSKPPLPPVYDGNDLNRRETLNPMSITGAMFGLMFATSLQARTCSLDFICVEPRATESGVEFYARNLKPYPVTLSFSARTRNLRARGGRSRTLTVAGDQERLIKRFSAINPDRATDYRYWFDWTVGALDAAHDDGHLYQLPFAVGRSYAVLQGFGSRFSHTGREAYAVDFNMRTGTPVHAARGGVVARVVERHNRGCWEQGCGRYANFIVILHSDDTTGEYYHLKHRGAVVEPGDRVEQGQLIGYSGNTGHTTMPHLHFAVYRAASWGRTQSIPFKFNTRDGVISRPRAGRRYAAPSLVRKIGFAVLLRETGSDTRLSWYRRNTIDLAQTWHRLGTKAAVKYAQLVVHLRPGTLA